MKHQIRISKIYFFLKQADQLFSHVASMSLELNKLIAGFKCGELTAQQVLFKIKHQGQLLCEKSTAIIDPGSSGMSTSSISNVCLD